MNLRCEGTTELGQDEIYVVAVVSNPYGTGPTRIVWSGNMDANGNSNRDSGMIRYFDGVVPTGVRHDLMIHVMEQDGQDYNGAIQFASSLSSKAVAAYSGGGDISGQLGTAIDQLRNAMGGFVNTDDYLGTFTLTFVSNADGSADVTVNPLNRASWEANGRLRLDGDGGLQYPGVRVDGQGVGQGANHVPPI